MWRLLVGSFLAALGALHIGLLLWMSLTAEQRAAAVASRVAAARHYRSFGGLVMRTADVFEEAYSVSGRLDVWVREPVQVKPWFVLRWPLMAYLSANGRLMCDSNLRLSCCH